MPKVLILDTSILCVWLQVPGKDTCQGWSLSRVTEILEREAQGGTFFVIPLATLIETGNHIAQVSGGYELATRFSQLLLDAADGKSPWIVFSRQKDLWTADGLKQLAATWPEVAARNISIGDWTIKAVADHYHSQRYSVQILTDDDDLKALEPAPPKPPRRRRSG